MMQFSSQLINTGAKIQINLKPIISYTTQYAISYLSPEQRGCYAPGEVNLTHLPYATGYHYQMDNCLIDQQIDDIIWNCRCVPTYADPYFSSYSAFLPVCTGKYKSRNGYNRSSKNFKV